MAAVAYPFPSRDPVTLRRRASARVRRRRQRLLRTAVVSAAAVATISGGWGWLGSGPLTAPEPDPSRAVPVAAVIHVVQPGETAWSIARSVQPTGEIRPLVDRLVAQEHGRPLQAGDRLVVS